MVGRQGLPSGRVRITPPQTKKMETHNLEQRENIRMGSVGGGSVLGTSTKNGQVSDYYCGYACHLLFSLSGGPSLVGGLLELGCTCSTVPREYLANK